MTDTALETARSRILEPAGLDENDIGRLLDSVMSRSVDSADIYFQFSHHESWSLEDGIVKRFLRGAKEAGTMQEVTRRPVVAEPVERRANPRSRSAKMRVARRL